MSDKAFESVWDAIEDDSSQAANMRRCSAPMTAISEHIKAKGPNWTEAAEVFAASQPRISDVMRGKIGVPSIGTLVTMLAIAGTGIDIRARPTRV